MSIWGLILAVFVGLTVIGALATVANLMAGRTRGVQEWLVHVVAFALVLVVIGEVGLIFGRGAACFIRGGCSAEEITGTVDTLTALIGTLVALLFAVLKGNGGKPPDDPSGRQGPQ